MYKYSYDEPLQFDGLEFDDFDDENDEMYRPKTANSRQTLAPLYVLDILKKQSDKDHPLSQKIILEKLKEGPYELFLERKALGRTIGLICNEGLRVHCNKSGYWYDSRDVFE